MKCQKCDEEGSTTIVRIEGQIKYANLCKPHAAELRTNAAALESKRKQQSTEPLSAAPTANPFQ